MSLEEELGWREYFQLEAEEAEQARAKARTER